MSVHKTLLSNDLYWWSWQAEVSASGQVETISGCHAMPGLSPRQALIHLLDRVPNDKILSFTAKRVLERENLSKE